MWGMDQLSFFTWRFLRGSLLKHGMFTSFRTSGCLFWPFCASSGQKRWLSHLIGATTRHHSKINKWYLWIQQKWVWKQQQFYKPLYAKQPKNKKIWLIALNGVDRSMEFVDIRLVIIWSRRSANTLPIKQAMFWLCKPSKATCCIRRVQNSSTLFFTI